LAGNLLSAATKGLRPYLALTVLCAAIFLPGLASIPPIDRDEARYMQASKQMLESGNYVDITFQDEPRNKKPVGIYWLQVLAVKASAVKDLSATWPYRLPSVLGAWLAVLATFHFGRAYFTPGIALAGAAMLATSLIVVVEAHIAKTDAALLAAVTLSMLILARFYTRDPERMPSVWAALLFWVVLGTGILIKGPLILLVVGVSVIALCIADRRINWVKSLHPEFGVPVAAAVVLPWLLATSVSGGGSFLSDAFTQDLLPKLTGGQESHGSPSGMHLLALLATAWPWSLLAPFALMYAWKNRGEKFVRFCLAWIIPSWIIFELVPTKLPHYTMPLFPALMLLSAACVLKNERIENAKLRAAGAAFKILWAIASLGLAGAIVWAAGMYGAAGLPVYISAAAALAAGVVGAWSAVKNSPRTTGALFASSIVFSLFTFGGAVPGLERLAVSTQLADIVAPLKSENTRVAVAGFHEPSAVFLLGTHTWLTSWDGATGLLINKEVSIIAVPEENIADIKIELGKHDLEMRTQGIAKGRNYSKGEDVKLVVVTAAPITRPEGGGE